MKKQNIAFGLAGLTAVIIGFTGKTVYRDYIHIRAFNDYGVSGFLPSYFYVIGFSLLLLIRPTRYPKLLIAIVAAASVLYEFLQCISTRSLDVKDILASVAGGLTALIIRGIISGRSSA